MRAALIALVVVVVGGAAFLATQVPFLPPGVVADVADLAPHYVAGDTIPVQVGLRSTSYRKTLIQVSAESRGPAGPQPIGAPTTFVLGARLSTGPFTFAFLTTPATPAGPYRVRVRIAELEANGQTLPLYDGERAFLLAPAVSAAPTAPPPPPPAPVAKAKPKPKPGQAVIAMKFSEPEGVYAQGETLPVQLEVRNSGTATTTIEVEIAADVPGELPGKSFGAITLKPGDKKTFSHSYPLTTTVPSGSHTLEAAAIDANTSEPIAQASTTFEIRAAATPGP